MDEKTFLTVIEVPNDIDFAIKVLHDEDMNGRVTKDWTGIVPAEGIGFPSGAKITFKVPSFKSARLAYKDNLTINIPMIYP